MKFAHIFLGLSFTFSALAQDVVPPVDTALVDLKNKQLKIFEDYKTKHPHWHKLPNEDYQLFFTEWSNQSLEEELKLKQDQCKKNEKLCLTAKDKEAMEAQTRVAIKVVELRNEYAKTKPTKAEQVQMNVDLDRAANIKMCQQYNKKCELLAPKDMDLVEALKQRDARIEGMESEFAIKNPEWKDKKGDKDVKSFVLRRETEFLNLNIKLNDELCHKYPKDLEFCLDGMQIEHLRQETAQVNCQHERIHQLYNLTKEELNAKEKIMIAGHKAQWDSLEKRDCKYLLAQDRLGESLVPPPVVAVPVKEEPIGDNVDEKDPKTKYIASSCNWVSDLPRRISFIPGCGAKGACIGFVVCDREGGGKFVRTSTCAPQFCGASKEDAVSCTKQPGYYTRVAKESKEFVSERLKRIFTGATKQ
ncbi:MAG TPA: hypothetical protein VNJ08_04535 [Bacteriovoracaceae bacterium]|nr:hypothetical protein [Bacteriovoracaceae bacterium]